LIPDSVGEATYGSIWNSWKQVWYSPTNTDKVTAIEGGAVITEASVSGSSTSVVFPYVRSASIRFEGKKLKPNTKLYAFFNEYNVTGLCYSANTTANVVMSFGSGELNQSNIITDSRGSVTGVFNFDVISSGLKIPAGRVNFRLTDSDTNGNNKETFADAVFNANGTLSKIEPPKVVYNPPVTYTPVVSPAGGGGSITQVGSTSTGEYPPVPVYPPPQPFPPKESPPPTPGFAEYAASYLKGIDLNTLSEDDRVRYEGYYKTSLANAGVSETTFQTQMGTPPLAGSTAYRDSDGYNFVSGASVTSSLELENGMPVNSYLTATNVLDARASGGSGQLFIQDVKNTVGDTYWEAVVIPVYEGTKAAVTDAVKNNEVTDDMMSFYQAGLANGSWIESTEGVEKAIANYAAALTLAVIEAPATTNYIEAGKNNGLIG
jgi:hypothetical protein